MSVKTECKTIVVIGASYGGHRAVQVLLADLPAAYRIVVLERNTHANHLYAFPRVSVVSGHEHKVFIPYTNIFMAANDPHRHVLIQANVVRVDIAKRRIAFQQVDDIDKDLRWLEWRYLVYAAGSHLPDPINLWRKESHDGSKQSGVGWLREAQKLIRTKKSILVVGGGALGVQFASDIAATYGANKDVTLTHSRDRLLTRFEPWMHETAAQELATLGVRLVLGSRVDLSSVNSERTSLRLEDGRKLEADLILFCLGQIPNTSMLPPETVNESGLIMVLPTLQFPQDCHAFAIGDAADTFGAINAGHTAWDQANVAAQNILRLIKAEAQEIRCEYSELQTYHPTPPAIKVSLGIQKAVRQTMDGQHLLVDSGVIDLNSGTMWTRRGLDTTDMYI